MKRHLDTIIVSSLLIAGLTACSNGRTTDSDSAPLATVSTESPDPATTPSEETGDTIHPLTGTVTYENDVTVALSGFSRGTSSDTASPENTPYAKFKVAVTNGGKTKLELAGFTVACQYGDTEATEAEEIFDYETDLKGSPDTALLPGRKAAFSVGCELPTDESYLQIELSPDMASETAIFAGKVQK